MAFAPMAASSSMMALTVRRGTRARTATHAGSASGAIVGDSSPGVTAVAILVGRRDQLQDVELVARVRHELFEHLETAAVS